MLQRGRRRTGLICTAEWKDCVPLQNDTTRLRFYRRKMGNRFTRCVKTVLRHRVAGILQQFQKRLLLLHHIRRWGANPQPEHPTPPSSNSHCWPWGPHSATGTWAKTPAINNEFGGPWGRPPAMAVPLPMQKGASERQNLVFINQSSRWFMWNNLWVLTTFQTDDFLLGFFKCKVTAI